MKLTIHLGSNRWSRLVGRILAIPRCPVLLILALAGVSVACWASGAANTSALILSSTPSFCDQGCAIADLDGDGRPDLAIAKEEGWGPSGFQYRIDLDLTTRVGLSSFTVRAQKGGLRIIPRDVNGDWEPDLIITSAWSFVPVGVWINDGHGGFAPSDSTGYPQSDLNEGTGIFSDPFRETFQATVSEFSRHWPDTSEAPSFCNELVLQCLSSPMSSADPPSGPPRRSQTRSPPFLLTAIQGCQQASKLAL